MTGDMSRSGWTPEGFENFHEIESNMGEYFMRILTAIPQENRAQVLESLQILLRAISDCGCC